MTEQGDKLIRLPVTVSGHWIDPMKRDWQGLATAPEPIVAVIFLKSAATLQWCKSERARAEGQQIRLAFFPYDEASLEAQINFSAGGGGGSLTSVLGSLTYRPTIQEKYTVRTGDISKFATVEGNPAVVLGLLFLAGRNVQVGRKGIWNSKPELSISMPPKLLSLLTRGRSGKEVTDEEFFPF